MSHMRVTLLNAFTTDNIEEVVLDQSEQQSAGFRKYELVLLFPPRLSLVLKISHTF